MYHLQFSLNIAGVFNVGLHLVTTPKFRVSQTTAKKKVEKPMFLDYFEGLCTHTCKNSGNFEQNIKST